MPSPSPACRLPVAAPSCALANTASPPSPLRVVVAGGGPVGLCFAIMLRDQMGERVRITVHDGRWKQAGDGIGWKSEEDGSRRRAQVVTLQSEVTSLLPEDAQDAIHAEGSVMWPLGRASPAALGPPRNIRIRDVEDRLLAMAAARGIELVAERFVAGESDLGGAHVLAICDGARSATRDHYSDRFGAGDATPYSCGGRPFEDVVLAFSVKTAMAPADAVLLTVAQNRFLLNAHRGEGVLNMRLTPGEAAELRTLDAGSGAPCDCMRSHRCTVVRRTLPDGSAAFACPTHGGLFRPPLDRYSPLWRRVREGLRMFAIAEEDVSTINAARVGMVDRPRFCAELVPHAPGRPATFGFLLGDAANAIHHWPGRGLNGGLVSAVSLARCLASRWSGRPLRHADFARHEGNMHMLQYRHKARAWGAVVRTDEDGGTRPIASDIRDGILARRPRAETEALFLERLHATRDRMAGRMDGLADDARLAALTERIGDETLSACVASGPWESWSVGGEEVDISEMLPPPVSAAPIVLAAAPAREAGRLAVPLLLSAERPELERAS